MRAVADEKADEALRTAAAALVGYGASRATVGRAARTAICLLGLLRPQVSVGLAGGGRRAPWPRRPTRSSRDLMVHDWRRHSPQVRDAILDTLLSRTAWVSSLLSVARGRLCSAGEIDPARRQQLLKGAALTRFGLAPRPCSPTRRGPVRRWSIRSARPSREG